MQSADAARGKGSALGRGVVGGVIGGVTGGVPAPPPPPPPGNPAAAAQAFRSVGDWPAFPPPHDTASYAHIQENVFLRTSEHALSTFSIDVDTASYANVRRFLNMGTMPPVDAVRIEEMINYFRFDYPAPQRDAPVSVTTEVGAAPWNPARELAVHQNIR